MSIAYSKVNNQNAAGASDNHFDKFHSLLVQTISVCMRVYEQGGLHWSICDVDLRYAIERELYFKFISRLEYFQQCLSAGQPAETDNHLVADVYACMQGQVPDFPYTFPEVKPAGISRLLDNFKPVRGRILFNVLAPRFLVYLQALQPRLKGEVHLLCKAGDEDLLRAVKATGLPFSVLTAERGEASIGGHFARTYAARCVSPLLEILHTVQPETIVNVEGCHVEDQLLCELARRLGVHSRCIQHGYAHFYPLTIRNMCYEKFLSWGAYFSEGLREFNPDCTFFDVGNFQLPESGTGTTKASGAPGAIGFLLQGVKYYIRQQDFSDFIDLVCQIATAHQTTTCYVREHPAHPITETERQRLHEAGAVFLNKESCSAGEFLARCKVVCSISASTLVEALGTGVLPLYVNLPRIRAFDRLQGKNQAALMANSVAEAQDIIRQLLEDKQYYSNLCAQLQKNQHYMFAANGEQALENMAREIEA